MTDDSRSLTEKLKFNELQKEVTKRRWADLLEEGKEFELMQEQMQVGADTVKELAGVVLASTRSMINDIGIIEQRLDRIEKALNLDSIQKEE
jgi:hypothetical protein